MAEFVDDPPMALHTWAARYGLALVVKNNGHHWMFRNLQRKLTFAHYWPSTDRLHIHRRGQPTPDLKFSVEMRDVAGVLSQHLMPELYATVRAQAGETPTETIADKLDREQAGFSRDPVARTRPPVGVLKHGLVPNHDGVGDCRGRDAADEFADTGVVPREQVTRKELKRRHCIRLLAHMVGSMMGNHRLYPADRDGGFNVEELVDKAKSALAAIEASIDRDPCVAEELHGK